MLYNIIYSQNFYVLLHVACIIMSHLLPKSKNKEKEKKRNSKINSEKIKRKMKWKENRIKLSLSFTLLTSYDSHYLR